MNTYLHRRMHKRMRMGYKSKKKSLKISSLWCVFIQQWLESEENWEETWCAQVGSLLAQSKNWTFKSIFIQEKNRLKCYFTYLMLWIDLVILLDLYRVAAQTNKSYITQKITFIIFRLKQKYFFTLFADKTKYGYRKNDVKCWCQTTQSLGRVFNIWI